MLLENLRVKRKRREGLFRTLMGTRAERGNRNHVNALNMIDIEFYGRTYFGTRWATPLEKNELLSNLVYGELIKRRPAGVELECV